MSNKTLKQVYDQSCERPLEKSTGPKSSSIKPSALGSPCLRKIFYSYTKVDPDYGFPLKNARIANLGTAIGKMLHDAWDSQGIVIRFRKPDGTYYKNRDGTDDLEFRVSCPELGVKLGKIDVVCVLDDGLWLGEVKSIHDFGYKGLEGPKPDHMIQGVLYLYLFNQHLKDGLFAHIPELAKFTKANGIRFYYYGKNASEAKEFVVTSADEVFKSIVAKIQVVQAAAQAKQLPPKTPDYCNSCDWRTKCGKNQVE